MEGRESHEVALEPGRTLDKSCMSMRFLMVADLLRCVFVPVFHCSLFHDTGVVCVLQRILQLVPRLNLFGLNNSVSPKTYVSILIDYFASFMQATDLLRIKKSDSPVRFSFLQTRVTNLRDCYSLPLNLICGRKSRVLSFSLME